MKEAKILAIIPAREGSKRVPRKNIRPFGGTTLVELAIGQCLAAERKMDIVLSSDAAEILSIGRRFNGITSVERPKAYAEDESPAIDYVRHTLGVMESERGYVYDLVVIIQPSSPFRSGLDIDNTIKKLESHQDADSAVSVVRVPHMVHPAKLKLLRDDVLFPYFEDEDGRFDARSLPDVYVRNCAVYVTWRKDLEDRTDVIGKKSVAYVMPPETSVDINDMTDFEFAEFLFVRSKSAFSAR